MKNFLENLLSNLNRSWNQRWLKFLFDFTLIGQALNKSPASDNFLFHFVNAYLNSFSFIKNYLLSLIQNNNDLKKFKRIIQIAEILKKYEGLSAKNFNILINLEIEEIKLNAIFNMLNRTEILNKGNINDLISPNFTFLFTPEAYEYFWSRVTEKQLKDKWYEILALANTDHPIPLLQQILNLPHQEQIPIETPLQLIGVDTRIVFPAFNIATLNLERLNQEIIRPLQLENILQEINQHPFADILERLNQGINRRPFEDIYERFFNHANQRRNHANHAQNTHTASVHSSVSGSAKRLKNSYAFTFELEKTIKQIKSYVLSLESSFKNDAAKRCIERITADDYTHTDVVSEVSTRELLAFAFVAVHDEIKRTASLEDALNLFIEGLYEIQRGYNLNEHGVDDESQNDGTICLAGTFNKLMEKLNGIHSDVEVYFITHEGAYAKFPKLVAHHSLTYLNGLTRPKTAKDYLSIKKLLDNMQDNGIEPIWDKIKSAVEEELWSEFKEAYANNPNHPQFRAMIDNGNCCNAPDLSELYSALQASPGYQQMIGLQMRDLFNSAQSPIMVRLHEHSLWANRQANSQSQHFFDRHYGLVAQHR